VANRSYLYSTNLIPGSDFKKEEREFIGISEWNYDIPIVFKLLLSGNPIACKSSIWEMPDNIALVGDYEKGVERLKNFLAQISLPEAQPLIREALEFLALNENRKRYFVLECGEIFDMGNEPIPEQNLQLLENINSIEAEIEVALRTLVPLPAEEPKSQGLLAKLFGKKPAPTSPKADPLMPVYELGLGNWSNILYFDFSNNA